MSADLALQAQFKAALGSWASGVAVVSTETGAGPEGTTVSSFSSVSLDPPLVLVCLAPGARVVGPLRESNRFAVSVLAADQAQASRHFAARGREKGFGDVPLARTPDGLPVVAGATAWLSCRVEAILPQGDHHIFVGRVLAANSDGEKTPLLYFRRAYRGLADVEP